MPAKKKEVPIVTRFTSFFDFALVDGSSSSNPPSSQHICRLELEIVSGEECPKATENFRQLTAGMVTVGEKKNQRQATYKGTRLLRCTPEMIQLGDTTSNSNNTNNTSNGQQQQQQQQVVFDGKTQDTIFGTLIEDEKFGVVPHRFGTVTLCNSGPNSNGSQFAIIVGRPNRLVGDDEDEDEDDDDQAQQQAVKMSFLDARHVSIGMLRDPSSPFYQQQIRNFAASASIAAMQQQQQQQPPSARSQNNNNNGKGNGALSNVNNNNTSADGENGTDETNNRQTSSSSENQAEALRKLHQAAMNLVIDSKSGRLSTSGTYIMVSDCGVL